MGVYAFRWLHVDDSGGSWMKIGHYKGSNAWSRVAHRGFRSCRPGHPSMRGRVTVRDLALHAWFPALTTREEKSLHRRFKAVRVGEWSLATNPPPAVGGVVLAAAIGMMEAARDPLSAATWAESLRSEIGRAHV